MRQLELHNIKENCFKEYKVENEGELKEYAKKYDFKKLFYELMAKEDITEDQELIFKVTRCFEIICQWAAFFIVFIQDEFGNYSTTSDTKSLRNVGLIGEGVSPQTNWPWTVFVQNKGSEPRILPAGSRLLYNITSYNA